MLAKHSTQDISKQYNPNYDNSNYIVLINSVFLNQNQVRILCSHLHQSIGKAALREKICHTVEIPVVAIGGIKKENIKTLEGTDVDGVAVVSAIFAAKDIKKDTKQLRSLVEEMKQK